MMCSKSIYDDVVGFKQPIPTLSWDGKESAEKIMPIKDEIFLVLQGERYPLHQRLQEIMKMLEQSHHYARLIPLDHNDTSLYLDDFQKNNALKPFENDYVIIY